MRAVAAVCLSLTLLIVAGCSGQPDTQAELVDRLKDLGEGPFASQAEYMAQVGLEPQSARPFFPPDDLPAGGINTILIEWLCNDGRVTMDGLLRPDGRFSPSLGSIQFGQ